MSRASKTYRHIEKAEVQGIGLAEAKIPVMLCCNDDNGLFAGEIVKIDLHDALTLESRVLNDDLMPAGIECSIEDKTLIIKGEKFPYFYHREWVGNIYWDLFGLYGADVLRLLNLIMETKHFHCEVGDSRLFEWWESGKPFGDLELGIIVRAAQDFRL
jgi:hypothetical protein